MFIGIYNTLVRTLYPIVIRRYIETFQRKSRTPNQTSSGRKVDMAARRVSRRINFHAALN